MLEHWTKISCPYCVATSQSGRTALRIPLKVGTSSSTRPPSSSRFKSMIGGGGRYIPRMLAPDAWSYGQRYKWIRTGLAAACCVPSVHRRDACSHHWGARRLRGGAGRRLHPPADEQISGDKIKRDKLSADASRLDTKRRNRNGHTIPLRAFVLVAAQHKLSIC